MSAQTRDLSGTVMMNDIRPCSLVCTVLVMRIRALGYGVPAVNAICKTIWTVWTDVTSDLGLEQWRLQSVSVRSFIVARA